VVTSALGIKKDEIRPSLCTALKVKCEAWAAPVHLSHFPLIMYFLLISRAVPVDPPEPARIVVLFLKEVYCDT
jgi:hypothetical protein